MISLKNSKRLPADRYDNKPLSNGQAQAFAGILRLQQTKHSNEFPGLFFAKIRMG